jgi:hypothetical protein
MGTGGMQTSYDSCIQFINREKEVVVFREKNEAINKYVLFYTLMMHMKVELSQTDYLDWFESVVFTYIKVKLSMSIEEFLEWYIDNEILHYQPKKDDDWDMCDVEEMCVVKPIIA